MNFHIMTLFPDMVKQGLSESIIGRAANKGLLSIDAVNIRDFTLDKHKKVDDYPYGGGAGMLMQAQPVYDAWKSIADKLSKKPRTIYLTPQGQTFTQQMAKDFAKEEDLVLLCGHYEGIDERVLEEIVTDYVSIGDYVLTGGDLPAMVMVEAVSRIVPGVLSYDESGATESFEGNLLEYPQYSRPEVWMDKAVPKVLLSGNQKEITAWRKARAVERTKERRYDLYQKYEALQQCQEILWKKKLLHMDMIEVIDRGTAELVYADGENICIHDKVSDTYFHTADSMEEGRKMISCVKEQTGDRIGQLVLHQDFMVEPAKEEFDLYLSVACYQAVYTRREKLPVSKLYAGEENLTIRPLTLAYMDQVLEHYKLVSDPDYIRQVIVSGSLFGAFLEEKLVGFVGWHKEGSMGMLEVFPEYQRRKLGKTLETYIVNLTLERGHTPYGQVVVGNERSMRLQEGMGMCFAKGLVYWMHSKRE